MRRAYQLAIILLGIILVILVPQIGAQDFGSNWTATFYNSTDLTGPVVATQVGPARRELQLGNGQPGGRVR